MAADLPRDFAAALARAPGPRRGQAVQLACSGGGDSAGMAALAAANARAGGWRFTLVHVDHGLRPEAAGEAAFVEQLASRLGLGFVGTAVPVGAVREAEGGNLEETARRLRYEALERVAREQGCKWVATGHTADDHAETLWLWLLRGTGLKGLSPLPARRAILPDSPVTLARPLLGMRRGALRDLLRERGIAWLEDPSNEDLERRRNRLRHRLLPLLETEFGLDPVPAASRLARQAAELAEFLDAELARRGYPVLDVMGDAPALDRAKLRALPDALAAWFLAGELGRLAEPGRDAVERLLELNRETATGKRVDLPGGLRARFTDQALVLEPGDEEPGAPAAVPQADLPPKGLPLPAEGEVFLAAGWVLRLGRSPGPGKPPRDTRSARFDADGLALPLRLVNPAPGLRVRALGGPGERKLSDVFVDAKLPQPFRARHPVLVDAEGRVLWVPGLVRGDAAPLGPGTKSCLWLDLEHTSA